MVVMTIRQKLISAIICTATVVAALSVFGSWGLLKLSRQIQITGESTLTEIDHINEAARNVAKIHSLMGQFFAATNGERAASLATANIKITSCFQQAAADLDALITESDQHMLILKSSQERMNELEHMRKVRETQQSLQRWQNDWLSWAGAVRAHQPLDQNADENADKGGNVLITALLNIEDE